MFGKEHDCFLSRDAIEQKASALLGQMTLKEKVWMLSGNWDVFSNILKHGLMYNPTPTTTYGVRRLGISPIRFSDGPRGVVTGRSTCFPVAMARGASFDRNLERRIGDAIGREVRAQGANVFGGVCINLLRHPAWGRAQETYGEDPYLVGEMGKSLAQSVQAHNVMACVKHFALNNIENNRFYVNVQVGARALHEVYLPQFKKVIQAGAASVMGAYNLVRGDHACESRLLLTQIMREEWGFEGFTMSDWVFGIYDGKKAIQAGMDVEMPVPLEYQRKLLQAVEQGEVAESIIDRSVLRLLRTQLVFKNTPDPMVYEKKMITCDDHIALAREAAERSMVLIKNNGQVLPFSRNIKRILVLGRLANQENTGDRGSSQVFPPYVITPLEGIRNYLGGQVEVIHFDESQLATARELAAGVDCVIIIAGYDYEDEGEFISPVDCMP